jgi:hypothetical protein
VNKPVNGGYERNTGSFFICNCVILTDFLMKDSESVKVGLLARAPTGHGQ